MTIRHSSHAFLRQHKLEELKPLTIIKVTNYIIENR